MFVESSSIMQKNIEKSESEKIATAKKNILWFGIISLAMSFAGITSAYVVSKERPDWIGEFEIPDAFYVSLVLILISSISIHLAKQAIKKEEHKKGMILLISTLILGFAFVFFQFKGFSEIISEGYYFTGPTSSITTSFVYLMVLLHVAHVLGGVVSLIVVIYNHFKQKYKNGKTLGVELAATFWHFIDVVWIYLFLFLYFVK